MRQKPMLPAGGQQQQSACRRDGWMDGGKQLMGAASTRVGTAASELDGGTGKQEEKEGPKVPPDDEIPPAAGGAAAAFCIAAPLLEQG
ncbi:hypothetical protein CKAH01_03034 [Colletotrichum kahawae]|uniref:Uncharacterized protein n=1 Tax=Colletotrichum kahawae TaxID=34407 RepID=A0AAD9YVM0_COLKA|nr:hypothetical protein CKAH01_03034 [Colletotrichum kahawae]